jgi:hypothetical protein
MLTQEIREMSVCGKRNLLLLTYLLISGLLIDRWSCTGGSFEDMRMTDGIGYGT